MLPWLLLETLAGGTLLALASYAPRRLHPVYSPALVAALFCYGTVCHYDPTWSLPL